MYTPPFHSDSNAHPPFSLFLFRMERKRIAKAIVWHHVQVIALFFFFPICSSVWYRLQDYTTSLHLFLFFGLFSGGDITTRRENEYHLFVFRLHRRMTRFALCFPCYKFPFLLKSSNANEPNLSRGYIRLCVRLYCNISWFHPKVWIALDGSSRPVRCCAKSRPYRYKRSWGGETKGNDFTSYHDCATQTFISWSGGIAAIRRRERKEKNKSK